MPLVLHGASRVSQKYVRLANRCGAELEKTQGISDSLLKKAIKFGIRKVNTDTDLRLAFNAKVREIVKKDKKVFDPRKILGPARDEMQKAVEQRIAVCGSRGKA